MQNNTGASPAPPPERVDIEGAMKRIDAVMQALRRQLHKRELAHRAIRALNLDLDLAQIDVLFAIAPVPGAFEIGENDETMVSTVAERLHIDPSRASRLVADMVAAGYARRTVSQRDARRTVLELTAAGRTLVDGVLAYKELLLGEFLREWSADDLAAFVPLLERYSHWVRSSEVTEDSFAREIAAISQTIAQAKAALPSSSKSG